jgi:putative Holliday junction resolvase
VTRLLGIDLGERRIGLALSVDAAPAEPLATIPRRRRTEADVAALRRIVEAHAIGELVVGLPLDAVTGGEGEQARRSRAWAEAVAAGLGLPLYLRDERHSSRIAEERVGPMKRGRSGGPPTPSQRNQYRSRVDRQAAAVILQAELDARERGSSHRGVEEGA